jgi:hypothetical protein
MNTPLFGFPIRSDQGTLSGGIWRTSLPLTNAQDPEIARKARSTTTISADTLIDVDLGGIFPIRAVAVLGHNLTLAAGWRVLGSNEATFAESEYDSGFLSVHQQYYPSPSALWGVDVSGLALTEQEYADGARLPAILAFPIARPYQFWRIIFVDTANPDGYVDVGRLVVCQGYQATAGIRIGARMDYETRSESIETDGGTLRHRERPVRRVWRLTVPHTDYGEAMVQMTELYRRVGTTKQFLYVASTNDPVHMLRHSMLATMGQASGLEFAVAGDYVDTGFVIREEIAP